MDKPIFITKKQHNQLVLKAVRNIETLKKLGYSTKEVSLMTYDLTKKELEEKYAV